MQDVKKYQDKEWLKNSYEGKNLSTHKIAKLLHCRPNTIKYWLRKHGLSIKTKDAYSGSLAGNWKGGRRITAQGYVAIYRPDHPFAWPGTNCVFEHRLMMEKHLGRYLLPSESVHHRNGNRQDNHIDNLELRILYHGVGQSVDDMVRHSIQTLRTYAPEMLAHE